MGLDNGDPSEEQQEQGPGPKLQARLIIELDSQGQVKIGGGAEKNPLLAYGLLHAARLIIDRKGREPKEPRRVLRPEFGGLPGLKS